MSNQKQFQVCFFPCGSMEDFLSERTIFVNAENEAEAKEKATKELRTNEDHPQNYQEENPLIYKVA